MSLGDLLAEFAEKEQASDILKANWYTVAAVALAAASAGNELPKLYRYATNGLDLENQKLVQRRIKEAILKTTALYGGPKALLALFPLFKELEDEEIDHYGPRTASLDDPEEPKRKEERGKRFFEKLWTPAAAESNLKYNFKYCPDLYDTVLNFIETELINAAALICSNCPQQAMWHTRGIVRHGGSIEQAKFVQDLALKVAEVYDCKTGVITPVEEIDFDDERSHA